MSLTLPQMVMLNHKAWIEGKKFDDKVKGKTEQIDIRNDEPEVFNGKKMDEMTSAEWSLYYGGFNVE